jgi:hypothetical protein
LKEFEMPEQPKINIRVWLTDSPMYKEYEVDSPYDCYFNDAGTLLVVEINSPSDEISVAKKVVTIPVHRIDSVEVRY